MPAYNAARTLSDTWEAIPKDTVDEVLLVDDGSHDETMNIARKLPIRTISPTTSATAATRRSATWRP
jgi:glycosyltransferase involved in cell wall biosynthesis